MTTTESFLSYPSIWNVDGFGERFTAVYNQGKERLYSSTKKAKLSILGALFLMSTVLGGCASANPSVGAVGGTIDTHVTLRGNTYISLNHSILGNNIDSCYVRIFVPYLLKEQGVGVDILGIKDPAFGTALRDFTVYSPGSADITLKGLANGRTETYKISSNRNFCGIQQMNGNGDSMQVISRDAYNDAAIQSGYSRYVDNLK